MRTYFISYKVYHVQYTVNRRKGSRMVEKFLENLNSSNEKLVLKELMQS